jgi:MoxR-like ATPase
LKRRCLYQWIDYPDLHKELAIVKRRLPDAPARLAEQVTKVVQTIRQQELYKLPGVSETLDWVAALVALGQDTLDAGAAEGTLGVLLKSREDVDAMRGKLAELIAHAAK